MHSIITRMVTGIGGALALAISAIPSTATAQARLVETDQPYVHVATGMNFPLEVGEFKRTQVREYSADGLDVSAHYRAGQSPSSVDITVYIYPAPGVSAADDSREGRERLCAAEFDEVSRLAGDHPGGTLVERGAIGSPSLSHREDGKRAVFQLDSLGGRQGPLLSEADLFCFVGGKWNIKYRITAPADEADQPLIAELMQELAWPEFPTEL